jgi:hypothetical protein
MTSTQSTQSPCQLNEDTSFSTPYQCNQTLDTTNNYDFGKNNTNTSKEICTICSKTIIIVSIVIIVAICVLSIIFYLIIAFGIQQTKDMVKDLRSRS